MYTELKLHTGSTTSHVVVHLNMKQAAGCACPWLHAYSFTALADFGSCWYGHGFILTGGGGCSNIQGD